MQKQIHSQFNNTHPSINYTTRCIMRYHALYSPKYHQLSEKLYEKPTRAYNIFLLAKLVGL